MYTSNVLETRAQFCHRHFSAEVMIYEKLARLQGKLLARCYGTYIIEVPSREREDDRKIQVIVLGLMKGMRLSEGDARQYTATERSVICDQVYEFCDALNEIGIVWPTVQAGNFLILDGGTDVRALNFAACYRAKPRDFGLAQKDQRHGVKVFLEELGYGTIIKDVLTELRRLAL